MGQVGPARHERRALLLQHAADGPQHPRDAGARPRARQIQIENPELRLVGIAEAFRFAGEHRDRYSDFFAADGAIDGPGFTAQEAAGLPEHLRDLSGIVVTATEPATS